MPIIEQTPICDTYIAKSCPNTNFRTRTSLFIGRFTNTKNIYRSLLVFNTPKIPDGDILITAYLRLYVYKKYVSGVQKDKLNISGSQQFSEYNLPLLIDAIRTTLPIILEGQLPL